VPETRPFVGSKKLGSQGGPRHRPDDLDLEIPCPSDRQIHREIALAPSKSPVEQHGRPEAPNLERTNPKGRELRTRFIKVRSRHAHLQESRDDRRRSTVLSHEHAI
jgi:hypothetical protein